MSKITNKALMLDRYGDEYGVIDGKMHPNPGTMDDRYSEIERTVDWLYSNNLTGVFDLLNEWVMIRVANVLISYDNISNEDVVKEVFYSDLYTPCSKSVESVSDSINKFRSDDDLYKEYLDKDELPVSAKIASWLNERFLRVRIGGKLNSDGEDAIYFRISSHGYDWRRVIIDYLWNEFGSIKDMPSRVVICHDEETNPPETILFDGTPDELINSNDSKVYESVRKYKSESNSNDNYDRKVYNLDKLYVQLNRQLCNKVRRFIY